MNTIISYLFPLLINITILSITLTIIRVKFSRTIDKLKMRQGVDERQLHNMYAIDWLLAAFFFGVLIVTLIIAGSLLICLWITHS